MTRHFLLPAALSLTATMPAAAAVPPADCSTAPIPSSPVHGMLAGTPFTPKTVTLHKTGSAVVNDTVHLDTYTLRFKQPEGELDARTFEIMFLVHARTSPAGMSFRRIPGDTAAQPTAAEGMPEVQSWEISDDRRNIDIDSAFTDEGSLRVVFAAHPAGRTMHGNVYLCAPRKSKSWIAGSFTADTSE